MGLLAKVTMALAIGVATAVGAYLGEKIIIPRLERALGLDEPEPGRQHP